MWHVGLHHNYISLPMKGLQILVGTSKSFSPFFTFCDIHYASTPNGFSQRALGDNFGALYPPYMKSSRGGAPLFLLFLPRSTVFRGVLLHLRVHNLTHKFLPGSRKRPLLRSPPLCRRPFFGAPQKFRGTFNVSLCCPTPQRKSGLLRRAQV